jgi:uncharacterized membrane protein SirB2
MRISLKNSQRYLATVWIVGASVPFTIVLIQTMNSKYGDKSGEVWGWLSSNILSTLLLILTVVVADALKQDREVQTVDKFIFRITTFLSIVYLAALSLPLLARPFLQIESLELIKQSSLWLTPLQGLLSITLGVFFVQKTSGTK